MTSSTSELRKRVDEGLSKLQVLRSRLEEEKGALAEAEERTRAIEEGQVIVQEVAQALQSRAHERIASIVTRCLATIFPDDPYEFVIRFDRKRGRTEARPVFLRDGEEFDPLTEAGGGVVHIAAFALRLAALLLSRPPLRRLLILDEPFAFTHPRGDQRRARIRALLEQLSEELGVQIVMVTHDPQLQVGKVVELG